MQCLIFKICIQAALIELCFEPQRENICIGAILVHLCRGSQVGLGTGITKVVFYFNIGLRNKLNFHSSLEVVLWFALLVFVHICVC